MANTLTFTGLIQNDSGDLRGVAGGDGELGCLCGKAGTSHLCDGSVVNGYGLLLNISWADTLWSWNNKLFTCWFFTFSVAL